MQGSLDQGTERSDGSQEMDNLLSCHPGWRGSVRPGSNPPPLFHFRSSLVL